MPNRLIFAKKLRLPSTRANVLQSLNMASAFLATGRDVRCFPGCAALTGDCGAREAGLSAKERRLMTLRLALRGIGMDAVPHTWDILPGERKGIYGALFRRALLREYWRDRKAVFYARDVSDAIFLSRMKRWLPFSLVFEAHEVLHLEQKDNGALHWPGTLRHEKTLFSRISGLVVVNEAILEDVGNIFGYKGPVLVAENGYNPSLFYPLPLFGDQNPWPAANEKITLAYVGNFLRGKGILTLIDALALLPRRFHLRMVGGKAEELPALLRKVSEMGLEERVCFYGTVPQQDVIKACRGAHMFVVPQQSGFFFSPLKLYEAMAMGLPVITTPLPVFRAHIAAGVVYGAPEATPAGLAAAIETLASSPEQAARLRERALREAKEHAWEKRARKITDFLDSLPTA